MFLETNREPLIPLEPGQLYLLGKHIGGVPRISPKNIIIFQEEDDVSQRHCVIETNQNSEAFVYDLLSSNGTLLNNKKLNTLEKARLNNGDILKIGHIEIKYVHDEPEVFHDSSGFLELNKNKSGSSPDSTSQLDISKSFLVPTIPVKKLNTSSSSSLNSSNRKSDSFSIPETQCCPHRNSVNGSNLSIAESVEDVSTGKVKFNFGNIDSFEGDDDLCIPETQEALQDVGISDNRELRLIMDVQKVSKEGSSLEDGLSSAADDGSQFRICTQDYNDGFGEEESVAVLHSQIIPLIKHQQLNLNNKEYRNSSNAVQEEKEMSALKISHKNVEQVTSELRADCPTPDIFEFEGPNDTDLNQQAATENININKTSTGLESNLLDEDEEDLLPTQVPPPACPKNKEVKNKSFKEQEKPCFEMENEIVITSSDKENRCPDRVERMMDLPPTQVFEVSAARSQMSITGRRSDSSVFKSNPMPVIENNCNYLLNIVADEGDDILTQAFLQPSSHHSCSSSTSKPVPVEFLSSTVLEDKTMTKNPDKFFKEIEKSQSINQASASAAVFKTPDNDVGVLKKTSSAVSATSENDLDLLLCTPQLIKDNLFLGETEDLKNNILSVKNRMLFGDETEEDNDDDDHSDLVKLINVPKESSDFDKLLSHLMKNPERSEITDGEKATKEAQKIYKFNVCFGKEQDDEMSKAAVSKTSHASRDERHVARDKVKESSERKGIKKDKTSKSMEEQKVQLNPAGRTTRSKSKIIEIPPAIKDENDLDSIATQPIVRVKRNRIKSEQNESHDSGTSNKSSKKNKLKGQTIATHATVSTNVIPRKTNERKRKADTETPKMAVEVENKRVKNTQSKESPVSICMSMVDKELFQNLLKNSKDFWNVPTNVLDSKILVMDKPYRTFKFLLAMARGIPIVTSEYLKMLNGSKSAKEVQISDYLFVDDEFEKKYKFSLVKSLELAKKFKIFKDYEFLTTANILPNPQEIKAIIEASGGHVHEKTPPKPKENQQLYLITTKEDKKDWHKYRRLNKNIIIVSTEAIMATIMSQKLQMDSNRLA